MTLARDRRADLRSRRPEWTPWLDIIEEIARESGSGAWDAAVPASTTIAGPPAPLLAGKNVVLELAQVRGLLRRLITIAASGTSSLATLRPLLDGGCDAAALFEASLRQDADLITRAAAERGADAAALDAVVNLIALPFLQACNRKWGGDASLGWQEGYCPVCGARAAFAELRGIERTRVFRCARCGGGWHARPLHCPYCGLDDHNALVSLVPGNDDMNAVIEACRSCLGYVKTFTRLQGCAPDMVMFDDLASVHLDVAAIEQGYSRPHGPGYRLDASISWIA